MSADTSDRALAAAAAALHDPSSPSSWLAATYAPGTTAIVLRATGGRPWFPGLRDAIETTQDVSFAYVLVRDKGLVLLVLGGVGGVKRAKAIVHARAFAAIFPDYLALATLTTAAELTHKLIAERLGMPIDHVVQDGGASSPSASAVIGPPLTQPASPFLSTSSSSPTPAFPPKSQSPPIPPTCSISAPAVSSSEPTSGPSSNAGLTPRGAAFAQSTERDLSDLPDDPETPRAAVQPAATTSSVVAPVPQRPRKRSASPPPSRGIDKARPPPHSHSQPTSPSIPSPESMPNMMARAGPPIAPTPTTPITPVTPKAPIDPNAPQQLYQGAKAARSQPAFDTVSRDGQVPALPEMSSRETTFPVAGGLVTAAATVLGVRTAPSTQTSSPLLSSPNAGFHSPSSSALSNWSDSPRQRSVSNSSGRQGSEASWTRPFSSRDSGYWGGRPPSRDASVPTSVTSDSRRSSRRGSDPSFSPSMLGRMSMGDAPPVPPLPHELRSASREPMRGEPEPLRVASVPHSPASSPLIQSPHSRNGSSGGRHSHFMAVPLPVADHPLPAVPTIPNPLPNLAGMPLAPSSAVGSPPIGFGSPPIPQRSRQRLPSGHGARPLPPPSPVPDGPLPPVPNVPPLSSSKTPLRPPRRSLNRSAGPSPDPSADGFNQHPLPPVPTAVRVASIAIADSGQSSLLSSPLVSSPQASPGLSAEPVSPLSPHSRVGSGSGSGSAGFYSARSSLAERPNSARNSSRFDSIRSSMRYESALDTLTRDSRRPNSMGPISTMLPYAQPESPKALPPQSEQQTAAAQQRSAVGLGLGMPPVDLTAPVHQRSLELVDDWAARPLSTSSFASIKSNRAQPPPPVTIPVAARTSGITVAQDSAPSSAASSVRSAGKRLGPRRANSISRKPVPVVDPALLSSPDEMMTKTPARKSSLRRVVEASVSPQLSSSPSMAGPTELLAAPEALMVPPPRDSSRASTPRLPPSPAFGTPPVAAASLDIDGGMLQTISPSPKPRSVRSASGSSSSSLLIRAASVRSSPRFGSPAKLERSRSLKGRDLRPEILPGEGRTVCGIDRSTVGSDVVGAVTAVPTWQPQTPQKETTPLEDAASPHSILSSNFSAEAMEINEAPALASAQVVTATPALARVLSLSNGQVTNITPDSTRSDKTRHLPSPASPSRRAAGHAKSASESETTTASKSPSLGGRHSKSSSTSETYTVSRGIGLGFVPAHGDDVERITAEDDVIEALSKVSSRGASTPSLGSRNVVDLGSEKSTPTQGFAAAMPAYASPPSRLLDLSPPIPPQPKTHLVPPMAPPASAASTPHVVRRKTSSKFRMPFRSPRTLAEEDDLSPPMSPTSARLRTQSITNAFRRRRNTNSGTPPGSPPVRNSLVSSNSTSEDHSTLPYEYGLQGLGLSSFALAPSAYRTPGGGIGYTPPKMERKLSLTAQEAFASARERQAMEQAAQLEAFRKSEKARSISHTSSVNRISRVTSLAMSSELMSDESHYDDASDEVPQSLSLAMVTVAGSEPAASPVEQLAAAASAARSNRHGPRYSPTVDEETERQRAKELTRQRRVSLRGEDEFHDAVSQMDDDFIDSDSDSELELNGFNHDLDVAAEREQAARTELAEREERDAATCAQAERSEHEAAERAEREAAESEVAAREMAGREAAAFQAAELARLEAAKRADRDAEELGLQQEREADELRLQREREAEELRLQQEREAEELRILEEREALLVAETRRLEKERLRMEAARIEEERLAAKEEERLDALLRAEEEERRTAAEEEGRIREKQEAESARQAQEHRLVEMEERLAAQQEEARLAAEREAEREAAERAEEARLEAEREEHEREAIAAAKAEQERLERFARERDEVTRQLKGGKAEGGIMLRGWVTVQTMNSPTWRRRYFHLLAAELLLFKSDSESDTGRPLTSVRLDTAKINEAYEESAVQGSWKLEAGAKEYYMFADSFEDRATVLQALAIAIG